MNNFRNKFNTEIISSEDISLEELLYGEKPRK